MRYIESINNYLHSLMEKDDRVYILGEDILDPYGGAFKVTKGLSDKFPDRVMTTPISEASITGFATGMAIAGYRPIVEIMFGDFITLCTDQIVNGATKFKWMYGDQVNVPLVIRTPMGGRRAYGPTHSQTLESLFFSVPGLFIIAPSNFHNPGKLLSNAVLELNRPTLFIENKLLYPEKLKVPINGNKIDHFFVSIIHETNKLFPTINLQLEKNIDPDVTILSYGGIAPIAVQAALEVYLEEEILIDVLIPSLIKPFPINDILGSVKDSGKVIIVEEGVKTSGWGAELSSLISEHAFSFLKTPVKRIGAKEFPIPSSKILEEKVLPQLDDIKLAMLEIFEK